MFFGNGRKPLLDFLRNLTPQIVMLAIALVAGSKLDLNKFDFTIEGIKRTLPFALCLFVFFASLCANLSTFIEDSLEACRDKDALPSSDSTSARGWARFERLLAEVWSKHKVAVVRMVLVMVVVEGAISVVFVMGIQSAMVSPFLQK